MMNRIKYIKSYVFTLLIVLGLSAFYGTTIFVTNVIAANNTETETVTMQTTTTASDEKIGIDILKTAKKKKRIIVAGSNNSNNNAQTAALSPGIQRQGCGMIALSGQVVDEEAVAQESGQPESPAANSSEQNPSPQKAISNAKPKKIQVKSSGSIIVSRSR